MKWMAANQTAQTHPNPFRNPVLLHRVAHVLRTGRMESARRRQQGRNQKLVPVNYAYDDFASEDPLHRTNSFRISCCNSISGASKALRRGLMTIDHCGFSPS